MKSRYIIAEHQAIADLKTCVGPGGPGFLLARLYTPVHSRGKGVARRLLKIILDEADRDQIHIYLEILAGSGLDHEQLEAWYRRGSVSWLPIIYAAAIRAGDSRMTAQQLCLLEYLKPDPRTNRDGRGFTSFITLARMPYNGRGLRLGLGYGRV